MLGKFARIVGLILIGFYGQGQIPIRGFVVNSQGGIPGATVNIVGQLGGFVTNSEGFFKTDSLAQGVYELEIRSVGSKSKIISVNTTLVQFPLTITLEESILNLDGVVVTGTMQPTFTTQSPVKVEVVTSNYINTYLPSAASSLVESISLINGVQEVVACGVCFTNSISINGLPGPYTAILMDGTPIYGNLASVYGLNGIPSTIIDRFEVIKGPSSTLYGSEAVAGVINIITKNPSNQPLIAVDLMGTSHLESFGNFSFAPKFKKASGSIGVNYAYINDFDDRNQDGFGDMASLDRISFFSKWNLPTRSGKPLTIAGKYYYEDRRNGVEAFLKDRAYQKIRGHDQIYGESIYTRRAEVFGTYSFSTLENLKIDYSFSSHNQNSFYGFDFYEARQYIGFTNLVWEKGIKNHQLVAGLTNRVQYYDDNTIATQTLDSLNNNNNQPSLQYIPGVFIQDEWKVSSQWTFLSGLRLDHYSNHGFIPAPRWSVKYKAGNWTTLRSNFGTGFRIVNLFTEDHAFVTGQREVVIVESLKPERSYNFSFNGNHIFIIGDSQGSLDVDVFYTHFTNKIIPDYSDPQRIVYENTDGYASTRGIAITVNQEFSFPLAFNLGVNLQQATETVSVNGKRETHPLLMAQTWSGVLTANYTIKKWKLNLAYTARVNGPMQLPEVFDLNESGVPFSVSRPTLSQPYTIQNIQLKKSLAKSFSIYGGVQNIFDYVQPYSPLTGYNDPNAAPGFSSSFDTSYSFAPMHGREIYLGVTWKLEGK